MSKARILIVDDNPSNLKLICDVLEFDGYNVIRASDAEAAQEIIKSHNLDLILLDIALPGMDGLTLTRLLKANESTQHILIVLLTAFAMKGDEAEARKAGCDGYITKPIDTRNISGQVGDYLRQAEAANDGKCK